MATADKREKRRAARMRKNREAVVKAMNQQREEVALENDSDPLEDLTDEVEAGIESETKEVSEKDYVSEQSTVYMGPTSWDEMDAMKQAREQAEQVREATYSVQDLVYNIVSHPAMTPEQKGKAIGQVGEGFGKRVKSITSGNTVEKELDLELLEAQAILARDSRNTGVVEKASDFFANNFLSPLPDTKPAIRKALRETIAILEKGENEEARHRLASVKKFAKDAGVGMSPNSIMVEKDNSGKWRAVMWPSNNFKDLDGEIIAEKAHKEYVDWVSKNMDCSPVFVHWHTPGTARENPVDFVAYENGYLLMSAPLTEKEAGALLAVQTKTDLGMSHGSLVLERDPENPNVITKYRMVEVSDLPLERAANPFTDFETISKEADVNKEEYLAQMLGPERAKNYLAKTAEKQEALRKAGVEEKASTPDPANASETKTAEGTAAAPVFDMKQVIDAIAKEFGMDQLSAEFARMQTELEKVPVLEKLVKDVLEEKDTQLAEMINPPLTKTLSWMSNRASQRDETVLKEDDEADKKLKKSVPELGWLSEATNTQPVAAVS